MKVTLGTAKELRPVTIRSVDLLELDLRLGADLEFPDHYVAHGALAAELYLAGGIRSVEIGSLMFGPAAKMDLVRLAIPRRVYTQSHIDYVVEIILQVWRRRQQIQGLKLTFEAPFLRHFTARLEPVAALAASAR